jgi:hypothetical protein
VIRVERRADGSFEAVAKVVVGVEAREVRVPLGRSVERVDPGGLRNSPVVVFVSDGIAQLVEAGATRSGGATVRHVEASPGLLAAAVLDAARTADVMLARVEPEEAAGALVTVRALKGRPLPVVPFDRPDLARTMLARCWIDLDIAIPSHGDDRRDEAWEAARALDLISAHHIVEVDPRPGLDHEGAPNAGLDGLTASATGVLAGRIAAGNRRWR